MKLEPHFTEKEPPCRRQKPCQFLWVFHINRAASSGCRPQISQELGPKHRFFPSEIGETSRIPKNKLGRGMAWKLAAICKWKLVYFCCVLSFKPLSVLKPSAGEHPESRHPYITIHPLSLIKTRTQFCQMVICI